jgi:hypothetical protein
MQQIEINFFWPLTEQIPLNLDYSPCETSKIFKSDNYENTNFIIYPTTYNTVTVATSCLTLDIENTIIKVKNKPNVFRRILYETLGIKWEKK